MVLTNSYDTRDNRTGLNDNLGGDTDFTFNLADRMTSAALEVNYVSAEVDLTYDDAGHLTGLSHSVPGYSGGRRKRRIRRRRRCRYNVRL